MILDRLVDDLRARGRVSGDVARDAELGLAADRRVHPLSIHNVIHTLTY